MPATLTGALKALLAGPLPAVPVFRDDEGPGGAPTSGGWVVVHEGVSRVPTAAASKRDRLGRELVQVDLMQHRTRTTPDAEGMVRTVERSVNAATPFVLAGGDAIDSMQCVGYHRQFDPETELVKEAVTVAVARRLT